MLPLAASSLSASLAHTTAKILLEALDPLNRRSKAFDALPLLDPVWHRPPLAVRCPHPLAREAASRWRRPRARVHQSLAALAVRRATRQYLMLARRPLTSAGSRAVGRARYQYAVLVHGMFFTLAASARRSTRVLQLPTGVVSGDLGLYLYPDLLRPRG